MFFTFLWLYLNLLDFLEFPSVKSSQIFTAYRFLRDTNFKDEKVGFVTAGLSNVANLRLFPLRKIWSYRFL